MTHGTGSASLVRAMGEQAPDVHRLSGQSERNRCQPDGGVRVGDDRHIHTFIDSVIDLLEVIEMDMHHKGEERLALYAKNLRGTYLARRINPRSEA